MGFGRMSIGFMECLVAVHYCTLARKGFFVT